MTPERYVSILEKALDKVEAEESSPRPPDAVKGEGSVGEGAALVVADCLADEPPPLFGDRPPARELAHEKPEHRQMVLLKARGFSDREIATLTGYTQGTVSNVLRQPHSRKLLLAELHAQNKGLDDILKSAMEDTALRFVDIVRDVNSKPFEVIAAGQELMNRYFGKPTQKVEMTNFNAKSGLADIEATQRELEKVNGEIARLTGVAKN